MRGSKHAHTILKCQCSQSVSCNNCLFTNLQHLVTSYQLSHCHLILFLLLISDCLSSVTLPVKKVALICNNQPLYGNASNTLIKANAIFTCAPYNFSDYNGNNIMNYRLVGNQYVYTYLMCQYVLFCD